MRTQQVDVWRNNVIFYITLTIHVLSGPLTAFCDMYIIDLSFSIDIL